MFIKHITLYFSLNSEINIFGLLCVTSNEHIKMIIK